eukprot:8887415-Alexandrium_andersonii.AAC.1
MEGKEETVLGAIFESVRCLMGGEAFENDDYLNPLIIEAVKAAAAAVALTRAARGAQHVQCEQAQKKE